MTAPALPVAKSWRDGPDTAPHHAFDLRLTDHYAPLIASAMGGVWTEADIRSAIAAGSGHMPSAAEDAAEARAQVAAAIQQQLGTGDAGELDRIMRQLIADAWTAGGHAAAGQLSHSGAPVTVGGIGDIDWSRWEPGHVDAAIRTADGALADALDQADVTIRDVVATTVDRIGNRIADGLLDGLPSDTIGAGLRDLLGGDASRAEMVAHTEVARAMDGASMAVYGANGIAEFDVITSSGACTICLDLAAANPHQVSEGSLVPAHPRCRCASAPHVTY